MRNSALPVLVFVLNILSQYSLAAQKEFVWDMHKLSITLPDDFKVVKNTNHQFECEGKLLKLNMLILDDGNITLEQMTDATNKLSKQLKLNMPDTATHYTFENQGFKGEYVLCSKESVKILLAGLINPKDAKTFFVVIQFEDPNDEPEKDGIDMLKSLENKN